MVLESEIEAGIRPRRAGHGLLGRREADGPAPREARAAAADMLAFAAIADGLERPWIPLGRRPIERRSRAPAFGALMPSLPLYFLAAVVIFVLIDQLLTRLSVYRFIWNRPLAHFGLFNLVFCSPQEGSSMAVAPEWESFRPLWRPSMAVLERKSMRGRAGEEDVVLPGPGVRSLAHQAELERWA